MFFLSVAVSPAQAQSLVWEPEFSFQERARYEHKNDFDLNEGAKDNGDLLYWRSCLGIGAGLTDGQQRLGRFFIEGLDARSWAHRVSAPAAQKDELDLNQAYVEIDSIAGSGLSFKLGRQRMKYGKNRLIAAPTWSNKIRSFDAVVMRYTDGPAWTDFLYGRVVNFDDHNWNESSGDAQLFGVYGRYGAPGLRSRMEMYGLILQEDTSGVRTKRYTIGARLFGDLWYGMAYDVEIPLQFGETGSQDIWAHALHVDVSRQWREARFSPRVTLTYNQASGDDDPNDTKFRTFVPLYGTVHAPYGVMDFFRWQNMREVELRTDMRIANNLTVSAQTNLFWLYDDGDYWYNTAGKKVCSALPSENVTTYAGQEVSLLLNYRINRNWQVQAGYAHFFPGTYARNTGVADDADWVFTQVNFQY